MEHRDENKQNQERIDWYLDKVKVIEENNNNLVNKIKNLDKKYKDADMQAMKHLDRVYELQTELSRERSDSQFQIR